MNMRSLLMAIRNQFPLTYCINFLTKGSFRADWDRQFHHLLNDLIVAPAYANKRYPKQLAKQVQYYGVFEQGDEGWHCHGGIWIPPVNALREFNNYTLDPIRKRIEREAQSWRPGADVYLATTRKPENCVSYNLKEFTSNTECVWEYIDWQSAVMQEMFEPYRNVFYPFEVTRRMTK